MGSTTFGAGTALAMAGPAARGDAVSPREHGARQRQRRIRRTWEEHYADLASGRATLAALLGYDDGRLMALADTGAGLLETGMARAALKVLRGLAVLDPWVPYFRYLLGTAYERLDRLEEAEREMHGAVRIAEELDPPPPVLGFGLLGRARVRARLGKVREALEDLDRISEGQASAAGVAVWNAARLMAEHLAARSAGAGGSLPFMGPAGPAARPGSEGTAPRPAGSLQPRAEAGSRLAAPRLEAQWLFTAKAAAQGKPRAREKPEIADRRHLVLQRIGGLAQPRRELDPATSVDLDVLGRLEVLGP